MKRTTITAVVVAALALCGLVAVAVESRNMSSRADVTQSRLQVPGIWYPATHHAGPSTSLPLNAYPQSNPFDRRGAWNYAPGRPVAPASRNGK
jgi:hypothetical protein